MVGLSHNGIAEVLGLPEYVASTTSHDHKRAYNDRSSIDRGGALHQDLNLTQAKSLPGLNVTLSLTGYPHEPSAEQRRTW